MRNFDYIKGLGIDTLHRFCSAAEENQISNPEMSAINSRRALEYIVREIYKLKGIEIGERTSLLELVSGEPFVTFVANDRLMMAAHYVRKVGNNAAHIAEVSRKEAFYALLNIYNVVGAVLLKLRVVEEVKPFDKTLVPNYVERPVMVPNKVEALPTDKAF